MPLNTRSGLLSAADHVTDTRNPARAALLLALTTGIAIATISVAAVFASLS